MPACRIDHCTRPEQSNLNGPAPPQTYGSPIRLSAAARNLVICLIVSPGPCADVLPSAPADPEVMVTEPMITWVTSGATTVPAGASLLSLAIRWSSLALGALRTIAFPDGSPRRRATAPETTASTPP